MSVQQPHGADSADSVASVASAESADPPLCSAKGCRQSATWDLSWRNPKLHDAARVKHWLACDQHVDGLAEFLSVRGFLIARDPLGPLE